LNLFFSAASVCRRPGRRTSASSAKTSATTSQSGGSTSATGVPVSACFLAKEICSSANLLLFHGLIILLGRHIAEKLTFRLEKKKRGEHIL
jgi:hypothetical protein